MSATTTTPVIVYDTQKNRLRNRTRPEGDEGVSTAFVLKKDIGTLYLIDGYALYPTEELANQICLRATKRNVQVFNSWLKARGDTWSALRLRLTYPKYFFPNGKRVRVLWDFVLYA